MTQTLNYQRWSEADAPKWVIRRTFGAIEIFRAADSALLWTRVRSRPSAIWWVMAGLLMGAFAFSLWAAKTSLLHRPGRDGVLFPLLAVACGGGLFVEYRVFRRIGWRMNFWPAEPGSSRFSIGVPWLGRRCAVYGTGQDDKRVYLGQIGRRQLHLTLLPEFEWGLTLASGASYILRREREANADAGEFFALRHQGEQVSVASANRKGSVVTVSMSDGAMSAVDGRALAALFVAIACPELFAS